MANLPRLVALVSVAGVAALSGYALRGQGTQGLRVNGGEVQNAVWKGFPSQTQPPQCKPRDAHGIGKWDCVLTVKNPPLPKGAIGPRGESQMRIPFLVSDRGRVFGQQSDVGRDFSSCCVIVK
jgi:hypothetical protein